MKTIIVSLPGVEEAMLVEEQKQNKASRDLQGLLVQQIREQRSELRVEKVIAKQF